MKAKNNKSRPDASLPEAKRPNILMIMVDEYRYPRYAGTGDGMNEEIKNIVGFKQGPTDGMEGFFPGLMRLRQNSVVLSDHTIASSACIPSRAALFTGQYGTRTGVTQTDGVFKSGEDRRFKWLRRNGAPTMGDWMKGAGYETYYFGKCHFADPPEHTLDAFGFDEWENSWPEPHGTLKNNLGFYRDYGFTDLVTTFLRRKGLGLDYDRAYAEGNENEPSKPWFAVASFTNPHDITTWPVLAGQVDPNWELGKPLEVPPEGTMGNPPVNGTWKIPLNPKGFPKEVATTPPNFEEDLIGNNKPTCHYEYSLKLPIALACKTGKEEVAKRSPGLTGMPFALADAPGKWGEDYLRYYTYLHHIVDHHIDQVMKTLDETRLNENTIVLFVPDHGEYGGAHGGMLQKWHTAYQETVQVPVVVSLPPSYDVDNNNGPLQIDKLTSHIDLLPTLMGLADIGPEDRELIAEELDLDHKYIPLVGADLSGLITGREEKIYEPGNTPVERKGVLFATDDMITEYITDDYSEEKEETEYLHDYKLYEEMIPFYQSKPEWSHATGNLNVDFAPVAQPCHLVCYREGPWKLVRYASSEGHKAENDRYEWELYHLESDPTEDNNLLVAKSHTFQVNSQASLPNGMTEADVLQKANDLYAEMLLQIEAKLA